MRTQFMVWQLVCVLAGLTSQFALGADEAEEDKVKGRLPAYYKEVIDTQQRDKIYAMQGEFAAKIAPLQEQIKKLVAERDIAIEKILTAEQLEKLNKIRAAAATKRKAAGLGPMKPEPSTK